MDKATQKLKKAEFYSNLETSETENETRKRKIIKKRRFESESDSDDSEINNNCQSQRLTLNKIQRPPAPPAKLILNKSGPSIINDSK